MFKSKMKQDMKEVDGENKKNQENNQDPNDNDGTQDEKDTINESKNDDENTEKAKLRDAEIEEEKEL